MSTSNANDGKLVAKSGTSMASPVVAGIMATFIGYERINNNVNAVEWRLTKNAIPNILTGFDSRTPNPLFANNGINNVNKEPLVPYYGAPGRELKVKAKLLKDDVSTAVTVAPAATDVESTNLGASGSVTTMTGKASFVAHHSHLIALTSINF